MITILTGLATPTKIQFKNLKVVCELVMSYFVNITRQLSYTRTVFLTFERRSLIDQECLCFCSLYFQLTTPQSFAEVYSHQ